MYKSNKCGSLFLPFYSILFVLCQGCGQSDLRYTNFSGETSFLNVLEGREVMFLYPAGEYRADSLARLLETYDRAYTLGVELSDREPSTPSGETGKLPVAIVPSTCGPGCGRLGVKGIEITEEKFERIYREFVTSGRHDHLFFYELGRNFWFYGEESSDREWEAIHTGFAVFFRDLLISELGLAVAPINSVPYEIYRLEKQERWEQYWAVSAVWTWEAIQPAKKVHYSHAPHFWSAMWWQIYREQGREGVKSALDGFRKQQAPSNGEGWYNYLINLYETMPG
jgi:hypothetical protein